MNIFLSPDIGDPAVKACRSNECFGFDMMGSSQELGGKACPLRGSVNLDARPGLFPPPPSYTFPREDHCPGEMAANAVDRQAKAERSS